jgi:hypothetical protein
MGESAMKFKVKREERRRRNLSENNAFGYFGHTTVTVGEVWLHKVPQQEAGGWVQIPRYSFDGLN